jgi:hypothetical protein
MKKLMSALLMTALLCTAAACAESVSELPAPLSAPPNVAGETINNLMKNAAPETSALIFSYFDGETGFRGTIYEESDVRAIVDELNAVQATEILNWSAADAAFPIYGLWIGGKDGRSINAAWSNGYWITQEGKAYKFDYDFESLRQKDWQDKGDAGSFAGFPNARFFAQDENGWNTAFMTPAAEPGAPEGITMTLKSQKKEKVTVNFKNNSDKEWMFGEHFRLQAEISGTWYEISPAPGNDVLFHDIGLIIPAGETVKKTYKFGDLYGDLPVGKYRVVTYGLTAEFTVE